MKKHIPNTLTCCNLICGCVATLQAYEYHFGWAFLFIVIGAVFDFFDGFAARLLKVSSPIGKELDSLADDITFGFAPATIIFSLLRMALTTGEGGWTELLPYIAFIVAAFSALRLAKFNLDTRQTTEFIGLPTPANALFWSSVGITMTADLLQQPYMPYLLIGGALFSAWILISEIPMFALKFKSYGWKGNELRFLFMLFSLITLVILREKAFILIIPCYILISILRYFSSKPKEKV